MSGKILQMLRDNHGNSRRKTSGAGEVMTLEEQRDVSELREGIFFTSLHEFIAFR